MNLLLLGTSGCHLCENAEQIVNECLISKPNGLLRLIDIADETHWQPDYAILIPVLMHEETKRTLLWPFAHDQVINFFETIKL
jgi:fumarate hydratase, class II